MAIMNAPDFAAVEAYVNQSPYFKADCYKRIKIVEYVPIAGTGILKQEAS